MDKRIKLSVKRVDIQAAQANHREDGLIPINPASCPISCAAKREFPACYAFTFYRWMEINSHRYHLSLTAQRWIARYDKTRWRDAKPFTFVATLA